MRHPRLIILVAAAALGLSGSAVAQSVYGSGGTPCQNWTINKPRKWQHLGDLDWLMGYVSGINRSRGPGSKLMGQATLRDADTYVSQFCAANPAMPIFQAADSWIAALDQQGAR